jgi:hypothetical protein
VIGIICDVNHREILMLRVLKCPDKSKEKGIWFVNY